MKNEELVYISGSEYPSDSANSVQVVNQANGIASISVNVRVLARRRRGSNALPREIARDYGLCENNELEIMGWPKWLPGLLKSLIYPFWVALRIPKGTSVIYGRHALGLLIGSVIRSPRVVIYECHGPLSIVERFAVTALCRFKRLNRVVAISSALSYILKRECKFLHGIDMLVEHDGCVVPRKLDIDTSPVAVGYVGSLLSGRGMDLLVGLALRLPDIPFHIVGGSASELAQISGRRVPENIKCHGRVKPAAIGSYYRLFNVAVAPYSFNVKVPHGANTVDYMSPLKIFEYMGQGKAILASDLPVLREVLTDEVNALLAAPEDLSAWEKSLTRLRDRKLRRALAENAINEAKRKRTWAARAQRILVDKPSS